MKSALNPSILSITLVLMLAGCGGSSGGGGGNPVTPSLDDDPIELSVVNPVDTTIGAEQCAFELSNSSTMESVGIQNTAAACDYFVSKDQFVDEDLTIPAGTTFLMADGVSVRFRNATVSMNGSSAAPITFQSASADGGYWGSLVFNDSVVSINHLVVDKGGKEENLNFEVKASVVINSSELSLTNSVFMNSNVSGLELGYSAEINEFSGNQMLSNTNFGLIVDSDAVLSQLEANSNYSGGSSSNGLPAIFGDFGRAENMVIEDLGAPYYFEELGTTDVVVRAGVEFWFAPGTGLSASGSFYARGTEAKPIVFSGTPDAIENWAGIDAPSRTFRLENFEIIGGGLGSAGGSINYSSTGSDSYIQNGSIKNSQGWSIYCPNSSSGRGNLIFENLEITNSLAGDIHPQCNDTIAESVARSDLPIPNPPMALTNAIDECAERLIADEVPAILRNGESECDYHIRGYDVRRSNLIIEAGTGIVMADGSRLDIEGGTLTANGTQAQPIVIQGELTARGAWQGIQITGSLGNQLNHVVLHGGGDWKYPALNLLNADVEIRNSQVTGSDSYGVAFETRTDLVGFASNQFASNTKTGLKINTAQLELLDSDTIYNAIEAPNQLPGIELGGDAGKPESDTFTNVGAPWYIATIVRVNSGFNSPLTTVEAGTEFVLGPNASFQTSTPINLDGTALAPITFSGADESGPINNWGSVIIGDEASLNHVEVMGGGSVPEFAGAIGTDAQDETGSLLLRGIGARVTFMDVTIADGLGWGVTCVSTGGPSTLVPPTLTVNNTVFTNNALGDVSPECEFVE